jgi:hypothetical protein
MDEKFLTPDELQFVTELGDATIDLISEQGYGYNCMATLGSSILVAALSCLISEGDTVRVERLCNKMREIADNYTGQPRVLN